MMKPLRFAFLGALVIASSTMFVMRATRSPQRVSGTEEADRNPAAVTLDEEVRKRFERARFFDEAIVPVIQATERENIAAAERCVARIHELLAGYHAGVNPFVGEMTSMRTRLGILKRMPGDWWKEDERVQRYVQDKFAKHLFTEEQLADDLSRVMLDLHHDIQANQNQMLVRVQVAMTSADLPDVTLAAADEFFAPISKQLTRYSADQGMASVENMLGAFVLGEAGAFAARSIIAGLLSRFAPSAALSVAAGTSATVGASATGAGGGSLAGPVGTVVGFGAGLVVGLVIDWWMTERFEAKLRQKMHVYLDDLGSALLHGSPSDEMDPSRPSGGLVQALPAVCDELEQAYRNRFFEQVVEGQR
ncbi:MAG: hypothetical protein AAFV88_23385 [Planctomycetota bacterium]